MSEPHKARKRFGQNFLVDQNIIQKIVSAISPKSDDRLIEIGPGLGALTVPLLQQNPGLTVIELDRDLAERLQAEFSGNPGFNLIQQDALTVDFNSLTEGNTQLRIAGNLPYNISSPLIFYLLSFSDQINDMHFMLQKEVVDRMAAAPGSKAYGRLSVMVQYRCQVQPLFGVPPSAFKPAPKVDSAIVRLMPYTPLPIVAEDEKLFAAIVKCCFQQRRKTLRNSLKQLRALDKIDLSFESLSLSANSRPEELSVADFVSLSNHLK